MVGSGGEACAPGTPACCSGGCFARVKWHSVKHQIHQVANRTVENKGNLEA